MQLYECLEDFAYYVDVKDVPRVPDVGELMDILFDDYALDSEYYDKDVCVVYAPSENCVRKLEKCLKFYGASIDVIKNIVNRNNIHENKKYFNNKQMRRNNNLSRVMQRRINESLRERSTFNRYDRILETYEVNMFGDFDPIFEAEEKDACKCRYNGKLISKMSKAEKVAAKKEIRNEIKDLKAEIKSLVKAGKSTKMLEKKLEKLELTLNCLMGRCGEVNESSVSMTFARNRRLFEGEDDDLFADETDNDTNDDETAEEPSKSAEETTDDKEEYEDVEMKAVVLTVLKKNVETVKSAMVEAGVSDEDINVDEIDDDASDDDKVDIRVDVNSIDALKTYLESVGINLEDELDGEIVSASDEETTDDVNTDEEPKNSDEESVENFDDLFAE